MQYLPLELKILSLEISCGLDDFFWLPVSAAFPKSSDPLISILGDKRG